MTAITTARLTPPPDRFPPGTSVGAYRGNAWSGTDKSVAPTGTADATAVVASDGSLSFTGLTDQTSYHAYAAGSGPAVRFTTRHDFADDLAALGAGGGGAGGVVVYTAGAWPARPSTSNSVVWIGPTTPPGMLDNDAWIDSDEVPIAPTGSSESAWGIARTLSPWETSNAGQAVTANRIVYMRVRGSKTGSTGALVGVVTAAGNIGIGLYANNGVGRAATPGAQKATTGLVACPAAGMVTVPWAGGAVNVAEGDWLGFVCDDAATARFVRSNIVLVRTEAAAGNALAQNLASATPPATPSGVFQSSVAFYAEAV